MIAPDGLRPAHPAEREAERTADGRNDLRVPAIAGLEALGHVAGSQDDGAEVLHRVDLQNERKLLLIEIHVNPIPTVDDEVLLLDVTPISLGIETNGSMMTKLIEANTTIPTSKKQTFTTAVDNQPAVSIVVLQGERPMSRDNKIIGQFNLDGIAPAPRGIPQIEVTFDIDANGILSVSAKDLGTSKEQHITIDKSNSLSQEEIDRIKKEAEDHKAEDDKKAEDVRKINEAETYMYSIENLLRDEKMSEKITEDEKKELEDLKNKLDEAIKTRDLEKITPAKEALEKCFTPIITKIYQENAPQGEQGAAGETPFGNANPFGNNGPFGDVNFTNANQSN